MSGSLNSRILLDIRTFRIPDFIRRHADFRDPAVVDRIPGHLKVSPLQGQPNVGVHYLQIHNYSIPPSVVRSTDVLVANIRKIHCGFFDVDIGNAKA